MRARVVGETAVLLECADAAETRAAYAAARREAADAVDVVPAARTVLLDGVADPAVTCAAAATWDLTGAGVEEVAGALVEIAVRYDGPDLDDVAARWGVSREAAVRIHREAGYVVAFCGFAPGFAYCTGLAERYAVPRLETPRSSVPAGAVGLAGEYTGVYPTASPGGWRLIGRTDAPLWRPDRDPPALLAPGTPVRFVDA